MTTETVIPMLKKPAVLMPEKMGLAESKRHDWVVDIDPDLPLEAIVEPAFWAHCAFQMEPSDVIEARWEDGTKIAHLRVQFCERTYARVKLISVEELGETITEAPPSSMLHEIEWKGPQMKFAVIRLSDKMVVQSGFKQRTQAAAWMTEHERS